MEAQQVDIIDFSSFLNEAGWGDADVTPMGADMGFRRYFKLCRGDEAALLMDMSRAGILETGLAAYVRVAEYLDAGGVRVPAIYHHDLQTGLAVVEDLGNQSAGDAVKAGTDKAKLYEQATDILIKMRGISSENVLNLTGYKDTLIWKRLGQFVDYYMPVAAGRKTTQQDHEEFRAMWDEVENGLPECPHGVCHADFHLENVIWRPNSKEGYGLIDFQDAFWGPLPYDLLNLLEDARQTVPDDIKSAMFARYCEGMDEDEKAAFRAWYDVLSAQFHCRVIGLFIKFSQENERQEFMAHIPRLQNYIKKHLENPLLAPLKVWVERHNIDFDSPVNL